jgi:hypothetical protein
MSERHAPGTKHRERIWPEEKSGIVRPNNETKLITYPKPMERVQTTVAGGMDKSNAAQSAVCNVRRYIRS